MKWWKCLLRVGYSVSQLEQLMCNVLSFLLIFSFRKSFFSGHASFAMYTMLYLAVSALQSRISKKLIINVTFIFTYEYITCKYFIWR